LRIFVLQTSSQFKFKLISKSIKFCGFKFETNSIMTSFNIIRISIAKWFENWARKSRNAENQIVGMSNEEEKCFELAISFEFKLFWWICSYAIPHGSVLVFIHHVVCTACRREIPFNFSRTLFNAAARSQTSRGEFLKAHSKNIPDILHWNYFP
jgi:hypothetical protein